MAVGNAEHEVEMAGHLALAIFTSPLGPRSLSSTVSW